MRAFFPAREFRNANARLLADTVEKALLSLKGRQ